jgi:hypothetical protein
VGVGGDPVEHEIQAVFDTSLFVFHTINLYSFTAVTINQHNKTVDFVSSVVVVVATIRRRERNRALLLCGRCGAVARRAARRSSPCVSRYHAHVGRGGDGGGQRLTSNQAPEAQDTPLFNGATWGDG